MFTPRFIVRPRPAVIISTILPCRASPAPFIRSRRRLLSSTCIRQRLNQQHQQQDPYERLRHARPLVSEAKAGRFSRAGSSRNSRAFVLATMLAAIGFYLVNSQTVPVTGRRRFNFLSDDLVARAHGGMAKDMIRQVQAQGGHFLSDWDPRTILVKRVMKRLIPVSGMTDLDWEIFVIADSSTYSSLTFLSFGC